MTANSGTTELRMALMRPDEEPGQVATVTSSMR
jgi:hypothetical protein